ncbi:CYTH domain-containing protein [Paraglaciecola aquimarina]|uniref:CYTH domain-containing protein n=1 Tax=Paraglaciecola algarum TaxID=3050085 RepID=A0ABS9D8H8_9ALTE|nr:CYTH domain-containing protein [Paraglaciecola sp. G1-23]MCF2948692.1 CYTH domain-containing protein [Paraglaciecola sp. G1-23]
MIVKNMEHEIELKLLAPNNAGEVIEKSFLPFLDGKYVKETFELSNYYFDTPDRILRKNDIGLRIRGNGQNFEQTLKTAGTSVGGLHQRPEFNVQLANRDGDSEIIPDLALFESTAWPQDFDVESTQTQLSTLFLTRFIRTSYCLDLPRACQVEMVWDRGLITANGQSKVICEIELELKKGQTEDLFDLARLLLSFMYLSIGKDSKAARGYRLADLMSVQKPQLDLGILKTHNKLHNCQFIQLAEQSLDCLQYYLDSLAITYSRVSVREFIACLSGLESLFEQFGKYNSSDVFASILLRIKTLHEDISKLYSELEKQSNDKVYETKISELLFQSKTTQLQLDIVQLVIEENWQPLSIN